MCLTNKTGKDIACWFFVVCVFASWMTVFILLAKYEDRTPNIEIASMDFTVLNITQTRLSANWDLAIRIPYNLPGDYICLQGDLQASLLYKNITLVTSSRQRYENLKCDYPQQLRVSTNISEEDISGLIGKDMLKDIQEKKEVKFGSRLFLTDCRAKTNGTMSYVCDETTLRFEPGSEMNATAFGKNPICVNV